jgi:hypothetical protein
MDGMDGMKKEELRMQNFGVCDPQQFRQSKRL